MDSKNWDKVFRNLYSWNALLPRMTEKVKTDDGNEIEKLKYRVVISTREYDKLTEVKAVAFCTKGSCDFQCDWNELDIFEVMLVMVDRILSGNTYQKIWVCPNCKTENDISKTDIAETRLKEPYFLGVVPKAPSRKHGLGDRGEYDRKVTQWASNFVAELEEKSTQFREDYKENAAIFEDYIVEDLEEKDDDTIEE